MISIKTEREISLLKKAGNIVCRTHKYLEPYIKAGITTKELDKLAYVIPILSAKSINLIFLSAITLSNLIIIDILH